METPESTPADDPGPVAEEERERPPSPLDTPDEDHRPVEEKGRENP